MAPPNTIPPQLTKAYLDKLEYETPFFLFDLERVERNYEILSAALRKAQLFYAVKANGEPTILRRLSELGANFEIASFNEMRQLLDLNIPATQMIYSNPVKAAIQIKRTFEKGMRHFAFDSSEELDKLAAHAPGCFVYLRFIVNDKDSTFPMSKKFGAEPQDAVALMQYARNLGLQPYGLTFHVGSQSLNSRNWESAIISAGNIMRDLQTQGITLQMLDIGGGFPADYGTEIPSIAAIGMIINRAIKKHLPYSVQLFAEPGRSMVADAGVLVTSMIGRAERGGKRWLYADVGAFNGMMETLQTNNRSQYPLATSRPSTRQQDPVKLGLFVLTGPTCDPQDTMFYDLALPKSMSIGDRLYIFSTGAYSTAYVSSFSGFDPPAIYYLPERQKEGD